MKTAILRWEVEDEFDSGCCDDCLMYTTDDYCQFLTSWDECEIEFIDDGCNESIDALIENKKLIEENHKLRSAFRNACMDFADIFECPRSIYGECPKSQDDCLKQYVECWMEYFMNEWRKQK